MDQKEEIGKISEAINNSKTIAIVPSKVAGVDAFAAGTALYHMLKEKDKQVTFIYQGKVPEGYENLIEKENVVGAKDVRELIVSIDYSNTPAAKVQYSTDNNVLFLKISPINKDFDTSRIKAEMHGSNYDLIVTIGAQTLEDFGQTYDELKDEFRNSPILNLDHTDRNMRFGKFNLVDLLADSLSLLVLNLAPSIDLKVSKRAGLSLLKGITYRNGI